MRSRRTFGGAVSGALLAAAVAATVGLGSSHREAPLTALDPATDDTDVYAFTARDSPGSLTVVANWIPFEDPAGGPNFYRFDDRASYYLNVDNTGDGRNDVRYKFKFKTTTRNPNTFLYAGRGVTSISDPKLNVVQTYSVTRLRYQGTKLVEARRLGSDIPVAPNNVGKATFPDYGKVAGEAIRTLPGGYKVFAGQRDDPFFVDLGATFDGLTIRKGTGNAGQGRDDVAGYNTHSIVLQIPEAQITRDRKPVASASADNAVVGVWASTNRRSIDVAGDGSSGEVQVSRLGNPLVNEVVIPLGMKDKFNRTEPQDDLANFGTFALNPELARLFNAFYGIGAPETDRTDIVTALLTGIPGLTQIAPGAAPADTLKVNLGTAPSAMPSRFGVLGGDTAGFPNGRRLADDVVDIEERVVAGALVGNKVPLGDGVDRNDRDFLTSFPYVAPPTSGFDGAMKRTEPAHAPDPALP